MSLREELEELIRWELSGDPTILRAYQGGPAAQSTDELVAMLIAWNGGHRKAILRLADEVDALKLGSGDT